MRHFLFAAAFVLAACIAAPDTAPVSSIPFTLSGDLTRADHQTYREIPFSVPPGVRRITLDFAYSNKENRTVIDIGLRDPHGQRGWSGGNKSHIEIGEFEATPSYRAGKIQPGVWSLVLGVPNIRDAQTSHYTATISFSAEGGEDTQVLWIGPWPSAPAGWFRGDFHMHTAHSDGSCEVKGARNPCPAERTFEAARDAGLDFAAISDHNTISQLADIRDLQAKYLSPLLIPGMEITTFYGHANALGVSDFVDFQLGSPRLPTLGKLFDELSAQGAILSINHPALPSGEVCMGCGWTAKDTDWSRVGAIEVINGSTLRTGGAEGPTSGIRFWDNLLKQGYRLTAIGGSDNHDATDRTGEKQSPIGRPTTVVYARELSTKAILDGVRSGRAFIDVAGLPGVTLDMTGKAGGESIEMGGVLHLDDRESASARGENAGLKLAEGAVVTVRTAGAPPGSTIKLVSFNVEAVPVSAEPGGDVLVFAASMKSDVASGYLRPELRDATGKLLLLGNPIYFRAE